MKKVFNAGFITISMIFTLLSHAQVAKVRPGDLQLNKSEKEIILHLSLDVNKNLKAANFYNEISTRALRNFLKSYGNISDVKWYKTDEGFAAYFTEDSIKSRVFYSKGGNYLSMLRQYYENRLPEDIRYIVKNKYADFTIYYINEANADGITIHFVKIENKTCWKTIRIIDMELEIIETVLKGNPGQQDDNKL